jgi:hypothetical protein
MQRAFAGNGQIVITSAEDADAYMQTQLLDSDAKQSHPLPEKKDLKEPQFDRDTPAVPSKYDKLTQGTGLADRESQSLKVEVKIWHLRTQELLFSRVYSVGNVYRILDNTTTNENKYLRADEAYRNQFTKLSQRIAASVVRDFLGRR